MTSQAPTATTHDVTNLLTPDPYDAADHWGTLHGDAVLTVQLRRTGPAHRFGLGFVGPDGSSRREYGGPILPGPYAYAYGLPVVIAANGRGTGSEMAAARAANLVVDANLGDVLTIRGHQFRIDRTHNDNIKLVKVS